MRILISTLSAVLSRATFMFAILSLHTLMVAQTNGSGPQSAVRHFPEPDFTLHEANPKPQKDRSVLSDVRSDGKGGTTGTITFYGGSENIRVMSLAFSGNGKILAVGLYPDGLDLWNMESRKKARTLKGGPAVGLSADGHLLAKDGKGIELCNVSSGRTIKRIPRVAKRPENVVQDFTFSPDGNLLDVTANGEVDTVYDIASGNLIATLAGTQHGQFSKDGSLLGGGSSVAAIVWRTKDWTKISEAMTVPDFVDQLAVCPERDLVVEGGPKETCLLRLSSGQRLVNLETRRIDFAAFSQSGKLILTNAREKFTVWDLSGKEYCSRPDIGMHISLSWDGRWLAAVPNGDGTSVTVWSLQKALAACGVANPQ